MKARIPDLLKNSKVDNSLLVFFITSPLVAVLSRLIIEEYNLDQKNILLVSFRNTDLSIFNGKKIFISNYRLYRYLEKILFISPNGIKIVNRINKFNKRFIVLSSWAFRELNWCVKSKKCIGHIYLEEGQASYMDYVPYNFKQVPLIERIRINFSNRVNPGDGSGYFYRDDSSAYIGLLNDVFPKIHSSQKFILNDIQKIKKYYKPRLKGIKHIGLTCAERRVGNNLGKMFKKLIKFLPDGSCIKLHPSLSYSKNKLNNVQKVFDEISQNKLSLCTNEIIIELEILFEKKILYGPQSSLSIYAKEYGSKYIDVKLY